MSNYDEFLQGVDDVDQDAIEERGNKYPLIQWIKGDQKQKKTGGFAWHGGWFIADKNADMTGVEGWVKESWIRDNGDEVEGFYAPVLELAVINHREWWEVIEENGSKTRFGWNNYKGASEVGNPRGRNQYLVVVKGAEDRGIFQVSLLGTIGMAFDNRTGALSKLSKTVIAKANDFLRSKKDARKMPFYSFWLKVGYAKDEKGQPIFTTVGKGQKTSVVCLPQAWDFPTGDEKVDFLSYYVGKEQNAKNGDYFKESVEWAAQAAQVISGAFDKKDDIAPSKAKVEHDDLAEKAAEYGV